MVQVTVLFHTFTPLMIFFVGLTKTETAAKPFFWCQNWITKAGVMPGGHSLLRGPVWSGIYPSSEQTK